MEGVIDELSSYVSYLEDLSNSKDPKLTENAEHVRELARRMTELGKSS